MVRVWLAVLAFTLLWDASGLDLRVMQMIGGPDGFAWRELPLLSRWLHDRWRSAATGALVGLWVWALWPGVRHGLARRERLTVALLAVAALVAVNLVKNRSATSWTSTDIAEALAETMVAAARRVKLARHRYECDLRTAATCAALEQIARVYEVRGIWP